MCLSHAITSENSQSFSKYTTLFLRVFFFLVHLVSSINIQDFGHENHIHEISENSINSISDVDVQIIKVKLDCIAASFNSANIAGFNNIPLNLSGK